MSRIIEEQRGEYSRAEQIAGTENALVGRVCAPPDLSTAHVWHGTELPTRATILTVFLRAGPTSQ
jgi:hypothetical protein